eukprot:12878643-Alexandrium_andersonii.AAC.1
MTLASKAPRSASTCQRPRWTRRPKVFGGRAGARARGVANLRQRQASRGPALPERARRTAREAQ